MFTSFNLNTFKPILTHGLAFVCGIYIGSNGKRIPFIK